MTKFTEVLAWYGSLSPDTLVQLPYYYDPQGRFKDPFNDVVGHVAISKIFEHMFATTENPRFVIENTIEQAQQAFVTWVFHFQLKGRAYSIVGGSHLVFSDDGLIVLHRDYWDAAEELLQKLPVVGAPIRWLRARFKVPQ